jgi:tetratricopeptide (TPR) repeat protein
MLGHRFELVKEWERAGGLVTWEATDHGTNRARVAVQLTAADTPLAATEALRRRGRLRLNSPHLAAVLDSGVFAGGEYLALELLEGDSLAALLERQRRGEPGLPLSQKIRLMLEVLTALETLHGVGVAHLGLYPGAVRVVPGRGAVLADTGLAIPLGSARFAELVPLHPDYAAPEQLAAAHREQDTVDARADLFSFGVLLYEFLTGDHPFGANPAARQSGILHEEPVPAEFKLGGRSPFLATALMSALEKAPRLRPTSSSLRADLALALNDLERREELSRLMEEFRAKSASLSLDEANAYLRRIHELDNANTDAGVLYSQVRERLRRQQGHAQAQAQFDKAQQSLQRREFHAAIQYLEAALASVPGEAAYQAALDRAREAQRLDELVRTRLLTADGLLERRQFDQALQVIDEAARLDPGHPDPPRYQLRVQDARGLKPIASADAAAAVREVQLLRETGDLDAALRRVSAALEAFPGDAALQEAQRQVKNYESDLEAALQQGRSLIQNESWDQAVVDLAQTCERFPAEVAARELLAKAQVGKLVRDALTRAAQYQQAGQLAEARAYLQKAARRYPSEKRLQDALAALPEAPVATAQQVLDRAEELLNKGFIDEARQLAMNTYYAEPQNQRAAALIQKVQAAADAKTAPPEPRPEPVTPSPAREKTQEIPDLAAPPVPVPFAAAPVPFMGAPGPAPQQKSGPPLIVWMAAGVLLLGGLIWLAIQLSNERKTPKLLPPGAERTAIQLFHRYRA